MTKQNKTLARFSPTQLERFLVELANLQVDIGAIRRFRERFVTLIPPHDPNWFDKSVSRNIELADKLSKLEGDLSIDEIGEIAWVGTLTKILCDFWKEPDTRQKEWGLFAFRYVLYKYEDETLTDDRLFGILINPAMSFRIPPPTPFEQALSYLVKVGDKARYCANAECPAPYFFVQRRNQRYCSEICAAPAQRELKRQWWAEHGEEWRAARQVRKSSKRGSSKGKSGQKSKRTAKKRGN